MPVSVVNPVTPAIERTKKILFRPFDLGKWCVLGFCAFLAQLGGGGDEFNQAVHWVQDNLGVILVIALAVILLIILIALVLTWLNCRGKFMLLDGVVRNRAAVVEPWKEFRPQANSLFGFRVLFALAVWVCILIVAGAALLIALPDIQAQTFGGAAIAACAVGSLLLLLLLVASGVINVFLLDFVVPIMYLRRLRVLAAWGVFRDELLAGHVGTFILYLLFKIVIGFAVGVIVVLATCVTCCIVAIPYVGSVILLPVSVFLQAYPLYFLQQFGPEWRFFRRAPAVAEAGEAWQGPEELPPDDLYFADEEGERP